MAAGQSVPMVMALVTAHSVVVSYQQQDPTVPAQRPSSGLHQPLTSLKRSVYDSVANCIPGRQRHSHLHSLAS